MVLASPFAGFIPAFQSIGRAERLADSIVYYLVDDNDMYKGYARKLLRQYSTSDYEVDISRVDL